MECQMRVNDVFRPCDLLDAHAVECHLSNGKEFLCGADHSRGENTYKHWGCHTNETVVRGFGADESVMCVDVQCGKKLLFCNECYGGEACSIQFWGSLLRATIPWRGHNAKGPELAGHPVGLFCD